MKAKSTVIDRRTLLKGLVAVGATGVVTACLPSAAPAPAPAAPVAPVGVAAPSWIHPASVVRAVAGAGGNLSWKYGDAIKWLTPEKIAVGRPADLLASLPKAKLTDMYQKMWAIRKWESTFRDLFVGGQDKLYGAFHAYVGEEATAVGAISALNPPESPNPDYIASTHRGHGHLIAKGGDLNKMSAEIFWKTTGQNRGYGGSMHIADQSKGILGANGIVAAGTYMAAGAAMALKAKGTGQVAMTILGDGACNSPYTFSALRSAVNYKLPYVMVAENNFQMIWVPMATVTPTKWIADYMVGLGIPSVVVDGNDVAAVYAAVKEAADRARAGEGPSFVEAYTWRWYDHSGFGGAKVGQDGAWGLPYRTDDEVRSWVSRDPIKRFHSFLVERGLFTEANLKTMQDDVQKAVDGSVAFARSSPNVVAEDGLKNVWGLGPVPARQF